jgi:protoheme IX farnesyltransferase
MKATAQTLSHAVPVEKSWIALSADLFKARLTFLVLVTTLVGFYMGVSSPVDYGLLFHAMTGTALLASGAAALNEWLERHHDARMLRTQDRPLPSGRMQPGTVVAIGTITAGLGLLELYFMVNPITAALGALTLVIYLFVYTPLKRVTWLNTVVGAIPGGLPPLMGWTAARGEISLEGLSLLAILGFWQLPHFMAIAWMYREDYARAGFQMLSVVDEDGRRTGRQSVSHTLALVAVSLLPFILGMAGKWYLAGALTLGLAFLWLAFQFARELTLTRARQLFFASIAYLPALLVLMVLDKLK